MLSYFVVNSSMKMNDNSYNDVRLYIYIYIYSIYAHPDCTVFITAYNYYSRVNPVK